MAEFNFQLFIENWRWLEQSGSWVQFHLPLPRFPWDTINEWNRLPYLVCRILFEVYQVAIQRGFCAWVRGHRIYIYFICIHNIYLCRTYSICFVLWITSFLCVVRLIIYRSVPARSDLSTTEWLKQTDCTIDADTEYMFFIRTKISFKVRCKCLATFNIPPARTYYSLKGLKCLHEHKIIWREQMKAQLNTVKFKLNCFGNYIDFSLNFCRNVKQMFSISCAFKSQFC